MGKKDIILFVSIFCILALIVGGTYAYWQWESADSQNPTVVFNTIKDIDDYIFYNAGDSHFVGNFQPSSNHCGGKGNTIRFGINSTAPDEMKETGILTATIKMDINKISSVISSSSYVGWAVTSGNEKACSTTPLASGSFNGKSVGTMTLYSDIVMSQSDSIYTVWVWVNSAAGNTLSGETIDVNIWTQIDMTSVD